MIPASRSLQSVTAVAAQLDGADLDTVLVEAALQTRVDRKYLLTPELFEGLVRGLAGTFRVLEIDGRRVFGYESVYFDTPSLDLFRAHRQGRRHRYKARTRTYVDSDACMFEVKLKGRHGETVKHRMPYHIGDRGRLNTEAAEFLAQLLKTEYDATPPALEPAVTTVYSRLTLVDLAAGARLTCDVDLVCSDGARQVNGTDLILVESKCSGSGSSADHLLRQMGVRPISISKYCIGVALLHRHLPANRWNRTLRTHFGWAREMVPSATPAPSSAHA